MKDGQRESHWESNLQGETWIKGAGGKQVMQTSGERTFQAERIGHTKPKVGAWLSSLRSSKGAGGPSWRRWIRTLKDFRCLCKTLVFTWVDLCATGGLGAEEHRNLLMEGPTFTIMCYLCLIIGDRMLAASHLLDIQIIVACSGLMLQFSKSRLYILLIFQPWPGPASSSSPCPRSPTSFTKLTR